MGVVDVGANTLRLLVADVGPDGVAAVRDRPGPARPRRGHRGQRRDLGRASRCRPARGAEACGDGARARLLPDRRRRHVARSPGGEREGPARRARRNPRCDRSRAQRRGGGGVRVSRRPRRCRRSAGDRRRLRRRRRLDAARRRFARGGPAWTRSIDLGSLRLTRRALPHDPPTRGEVDRARVADRAAVRARWRRRWRRPPSRQAAAHAPSPRSSAATSAPRSSPLRCTSPPNGRRGASRRRSTSRSGAPALLRRERCCSARRRAFSACRSRSRAAGFAKVLRSPCSKRSSSPRSAARQSRSARAERSTSRSRA